MVEPDVWDVLLRRMEVVRERFGLGLRLLPQRSSETLAYLSFQLEGRERVELPLVSQAQRRALISRYLTMSHRGPRDWEREYKQAELGSHV